MGAQWWDAGLETASSWMKCPAEAMLHESTGKQFATLFLCQQAVQSGTWKQGRELKGRYRRDVHRVPKLATPLASNTLNSVWSSLISTKYRTLHYLNITYCWEQVYKVKVNNVDELRQRIQSPDCMGWTWPAYYDKAIKQWRTCLRACVEAKGGHFEHKLWRL